MYMPLESIGVRACVWSDKGDKGAVQVLYAQLPVIVRRAQSPEFDHEERLA